MTATTAGSTEKPKRFRSPPYPMYDLKEAVERAKQLYAKAHQHSVGVGVVADAWGLKSGDGKVWRAAAALIHYGLLSDSGTGKTRKFQVTDAAKRIILDDGNSERRKEALRKAALAPMIHRELWDKFKSTRGLADNVVATYLTLDREEAGESLYSRVAAEEVLATFRSSIDYAGLEDYDTVAPPTEVKKDGDLTIGGLPPRAKVAVGDFVKWTSGDVDQFAARKVQWISEDGTHLRVIGSPTGIPVTEVEKVEAPGTKQVLAQPAVSTAHTGKAAENKPATPKIKSITTSVVGDRLQISADVSADEIDALKDMLTKYQEILKLLH